MSIKTANDVIALPTLPKKNREKYFVYYLHFCSKKQQKKKKKYYRVF